MYKAIGFYLNELLTIDPAHRGRGLSTELIIRCCAHRNLPTRRTLSVAGKRALERAHETAVRRAFAEGYNVPTEVRADYGL